MTKARMRRFRGIQAALSMCVMVFLVLGSSCTGAETAPNMLTEQEKADGWQLLWDGQTSDGWRSATSEQFPSRGWTMEDGVLTVGASRGRGGGDIITKERFSDFELAVDFKTSPGCNSGIKYLVIPNPGPGPAASLGAVIGPEYQILDDVNHPDARAGRDGNRTLGSAYDLMPAAETKNPNPIGQWNTARIVVKGNHVEHWLNADMILEYERDSEAFRQCVAQSKFRVVPGFAEWPDGHILLQDHGNLVSFRNIKIRVLTED